MTREETIAALSAGLSALPSGEVRILAFTAFLQLLAELSTAEQLLDAGYEKLVSELPRQKPTIDRIVFSRRGMRPEDAREGSWRGASSVMSKR